MKTLKAGIARFGAMSLVLALVGSGVFDRQKLTVTLRRLVETATDIVGEMPYRHYTFLMLGEGRGGLEHLNSMAVCSKVPDFNDPNDQRRWVAFIAHEFFHLYNVKAIRPVALGPFDYDRENYTNLLWFSEGGTVYYENLIANRAGFLSGSEFLKQFAVLVPGCWFWAARSNQQPTTINKEPAPVGWRRTLQLVDVDGVVGGWLMVVGWVPLPVTNNEEPATDSAATRRKDAARSTT